MNQSLLLFVFLFTIVSCSSDESILNPSTCPSCHYEILEQSSIYISSKGDVSIIPEGDENVFMISYNSELDQNRVLLFEIDPLLEEFEFSGEDLFNISSVEGIAELGSEIIFIQSARFIRQGTITGLKISNSEWKIEIKDIQTRDGLENFSALFTIL